MTSFNCVICAQTIFRISALAGTYAGRTRPLQGCFIDRHSRYPRPPTPTSSPRFAPATTPRSKSSTGATSAAHRAVRLPDAARRGPLRGRGPGGVPVRAAPHARDGRRDQLQAVDLPDRPQRGDRLVPPQQPRGRGVDGRRRRPARVRPDPAGRARRRARRGAHHQGAADPPPGRLRRAVGRSHARARHARARGDVLPRDRQASST